MLALAGPALAQTSSIRGLVRDTTRRMLADAEVMILSPERRVRTDSAGNFYIAGLEAGTYDLRARRLGFYPAQARLVIGANTEKQILFELEARPVLLDTVNVTATCGRLEFSSFVCRRRNGGPGVFMDIDAIDSTNSRFIADLFRRPGFRVEAARGGLRIVPLTGWRCMKVIVNGQPPSTTNPMPMSPLELLGVEIYADQADVPLEYNGYAWGMIKAGRRMVNARCTLVVYWTQIRPRKR
jgi:hypothetical protein